MGGKLVVNAWQPDPIVSAVFFWYVYNTGQVVRRRFARGIIGKKQSLVNGNPYLGAEGRCNGLHTCDHVPFEAHLGIRRMQRM